jgi:hypothetical protein
MKDADVAWPSEASDCPSRSSIRRRTMSNRRAPSASILDDDEFEQLQRRAAELARKMGFEEEPSPRIRALMAHVEEEAEALRACGALEAPLPKALAAMARFDERIERLTRPPGFSRDGSSFGTGYRFTPEPPPPRPMQHVTVNITVRLPEDAISDAPPPPKKSGKLN